MEDAGCALPAAVGQLQLARVNANGNVIIKNGLVDDAARIPSELRTQLGEPLLRRKTDAAASSSYATQVSTSSALLVHTRHIVHSMWRIH